MVKFHKRRGVIHDDVPPAAFSKGYGSEISYKKFDLISPRRNIDSIDRVAIATGWPMDTKDTGRERERGGRGWERERKIPGEVIGRLNRLRLSKTLDSLR